jgi:hypothetical protein
MSAAQRILQRLNELEATIEIRGDQLVIGAKSKAIPGEMKSEIRNHKAELIQLVRVADERIIDSAAVSGPGEAVHTAPEINISVTDFEERSAIMEYDGGLPREIADGSARLEGAPAPDIDRSAVPAAVASREANDAIRDMSDEELREHGRKLALAHYVGENVQTVDHEQPVTLTKAGYIELGHRPAPPLSAVRRFCIECSGGSTKEVRLCRRTGCLLFPYRMGSNPWRKELSPEKRAALGARLQGIKTPEGKGKISEV